MQSFVKHRQNLCSIVWTYSRILFSCRSRLSGFVAWTLILIWSCRKKSWKCKAGKRGLCQRGFGDRSTLPETLHCILFLRFHSNGFLFFEVMSISSDPPVCLHRSICLHTNIWVSERISWWIILLTVFRRSICTTFNIAHCNYGSSNATAEETQLSYPSNQSKIATSHQ